MQAYTPYTIAPAAHCPRDGAMVLHPTNLVFDEMP